MCRPTFHLPGRKHGRKEGQRRAVAVIASRKGEQNFLISHQREGDSQGLCNTNMELGRAVLPILPHEDRGIES